MFFFVKKRPAYWARSSYWSSDVCSSGLILVPASAQSRAPRGWPEDQARLRHQGQIRGNPTGAIEIGYRAVDLYFPAVAEIVRIFHCGVHAAQRLQRNILKPIIEYCRHAGWVEGLARRVFEDARNVVD